jgi:hypothetical protein
MSSSRGLPRLIPTGTCWCGCGEEAGIGAFFARGHDKIAEAALLATEYGGAVPQLLHKHGYGPGRSVTDEAVASGAWEGCPPRAASTLARPPASASIVASPVTSPSLEGCDCARPDQRLCRSSL